jgi:hypothetical protein
LWPLPVSILSAGFRKNNHFCSAQSMLKLFPERIGGTP